MGKTTQEEHKETAKLDGCPQPVNLAKSRQQHYGDGSGNAESLYQSFDNFHGSAPDSD